MLTTTVRPTGGTARLAGFDVRTQQLAARKVSSVVFQDAVVDRSLTGRRNLDLHGRLWGVEPAEAQRRIEELVDAVGLRDLIDRPVGTYSGGERRRMEIARALVSSPRVLFLDEPTVALDPRIRAELLDILAGLRGRDELTILVTTHYLDEAEHLADRVAIMHGGRIVALDTPERLRAGLGRELVELRVDSDPAGALATLRSRGIARDDAFAVGTSLTVPLNGHTSSEAIAAIQELGLAAAVSARQPTLDDVYLRLTGGRLAEAA
jgi:ABC-2 type transport system ATP-binding protein